MGFRKNVSEFRKGINEGKAEQKRLIEEHNRMADAGNWEFAHGKFDYYGGDDGFIYKVKKGAAKNEAHAKKIGTKHPVETSALGMGIKLPAYHKSNPFLFHGAKTYAAKDKPKSSGAFYTRKVKGKTQRVRKGRR